MAAFQRLFIAGALILGLTGCSSSSPASEVIDALDTFSESSVVTFVRTGTIEACPSATMGEMADAFMSYPQWTDFVSDTGETVVELEGEITYDGLPATARVQFVVDEPAGTFSAEWLGINDEGQGLITLSALLNNMCEATY